MPYTYDYPHPAVTVDCVVFTIIEQRLSVLLVQRKRAPFKGKWALPGGFIQIEESLENAARRELSEKTGVSDVFLEQLYTFGDLNRDPRERVVTVAYYALVDWETRELRAAGQTGTAGVGWFALRELPELAFDHQRIIDMALTRLRGKLEYTTVGFELLPEKFTLTELQRVYEIILDRPLDKRNFRKKMKELEKTLLTKLPEKRMKGVHRPAQLYSFRRREPTAATAAGTLTAATAASAQNGRDRKSSAAEDEGDD
jgi:8-oxo-dGTP diphosphatase